MRACVLEVYLSHPSVGMAHLDHHRKGWCSGLRTKDKHVISNRTAAQHGGALVYTAASQQGHGFEFPVRLGMLARSPQACQCFKISLVTPYSRRDGRHSIIYLWRYNLNSNVNVFHLDLRIRPDEKQDTEITVYKDPSYIEPPYWTQTATLFWKHEVHWEECWFVPQKQSSGKQRGGRQHGAVPGLDHQARPQAWRCVMKADETSTEDCKRSLFKQIRGDLDQSASMIVNGIWNLKREAFLSGLGMSLRVSLSLSSFSLSTLSVYISLSLPLSHLCFQIFSFSSLLSLLSLLFISLISSSHTDEMNPLESDVTELMQ